MRDMTPGLSATLPESGKVRVARHTSIDRVRVSLYPLFRLYGRNRRFFSLRLRCSGSRRWVRMVLHIATDGAYGFHRDELQTLDDAGHLDWGFVAYPPIAPLIGRLDLTSSPRQGSFLQPSRPIDEQ